MKQLNALLLMLAAAPLGMSAQSVIVVDKDGLSHKFGADYVKEIRVAEVAPEVPSVDFTSIAINVYNGTNILLSLATADGSVALALDTYMPATTFLQPGVYNVDTTSDYRVEPSSYSTVSVGGETKTLASGTMTVSRDGDDYTIAVDFTMTDGDVVKGEYQGKLPAFAPSLSMALSAAKYNDNPQAPGEFYVKFNDADYNVEMAIDFFADAKATVLPAGEYTYSESNAPGTFSAKSYVDLHVDHTNNKMASGTISVACEGEDYTITMNLVFVDTRTATITYSGKISGTPTFEEKPVELVITKATYSSTPQVPGGFLIGMDDDVNWTMSSMFNIFADAEAKTLPAGTYTYSADKTPGTFGPDSYVMIAANNWATERFKEGTMTVAIAEGKYTISVEGTLESGQKVKLSFNEGEITGTPEFTEPVEDLSLVMEEAKYNDKPQAPGEFYVKLNDKAWSAEMAIDFFGQTSDTTLQPGTYTFSADNTPRTFSGKSYVDIYKPSSSNRHVAGGTITVALADGDYDIVMELVMDDNANLKVTFKGKISGTPAFNN